MAGKKDKTKGTLPSRSVRQKTFRKRMWLWVEHPLTLSGGGAVFLAAVTSQNPALSAILLFVALVLFVLAFYRTNFFGRKPPRERRLGYLLVSAAMAVVLSGVWFLLRPKPQSEVATESVKQSPAPTVTPSSQSTAIPEHPDLKLSLLGANVFTPDLRPDLTGIAIEVTLRNAGSPSIATDWAMTVTPANGIPVKAQHTEPPAHLVLKGKPNRILKSSDFSLENRASNKPLKIGDPLLEGHLLFYVLLPKEVVLNPETQIELSVSDFSKHTFSAKQRMGDWFQ